MNAQTVKKLRPLSPDRPHQTESPYTTDKGHFQVEADLLNFERQHVNDSLDLQGTGIFFFNAKFGITKNSDVELLTGTVQLDHYPGSDIPNERTFFPDLLFRYKYNLLGNDSGKTAIALMPTLRISNFVRDTFKVQAGQLLINAEREFEHFGLGYTGGLSNFTFQPFFTRCEFFSTVSLDYSLVGELHHFVEVSYRYGRSNPVLHNYSFDSGFTFTPGENLQFDLGFYYFIPARQPFLFIGGTFRI
ncbi:MAG TPA: hypothetical protein VI112_07010 [Bacteroidia bacterium]